MGAPGIPGAASPNGANARHWLPLSCGRGGWGVRSGASGRTPPGLLATLPGAGRDWATIVANGDPRTPLSS